MNKIDEEKRLTLLGDLATTVLRDAADELEQREWTQRQIARKSDGMVCSYMSDDAVSFCAYGITMRMFHSLDPQPPTEADRMDLKQIITHRLAVKARENRYNKHEDRVRRWKSLQDEQFDITDWNDRNGRTKDEVLAALRSA